MPNTSSMPRMPNVLKIHQIPCIHPDIREKLDGEDILQYQLQYVAEKTKDIRH